MIRCSVATNRDTTGLGRMAVRAGRAGRIVAARDSGEREPKPLDADDPGMGSRMGSPEGHLALGNDVLADGVRDHALALAVRLDVVAHLGSAGIDEPGMTSMVTSTAPGTLVIQPPLALMNLFTPSNTSLRLATSGLSGMRNS